VIRSNVLGVEFDPVDLPGAERTIVALAAAPGPHLVVTANVELVMLARRSPELLGILRRAALVVPDGVGVVWGSRQLGRRLPGRVPGIDLADRLCAQAARLGWSVVLLGGIPGVAEAAATRLRHAYPGMVVALTLNGYFTPAEEPEVVRAIHDAGLRFPDDIAVACFDDFDWAEVFQPRLTTIAQPMQAIGQQAILLLLERLRDPVARALPPRLVRLKAELRVRDSSAFPAHRPMPEGARA